MIRTNPSLLPSHLVVEGDPDSYTGYKVYVIQDMPTEHLFSEFVPKGFTCNGGNIPKFARGLSKWLHPAGESLPAFVYHDYLIKTKKGKQTRKEIDQAFGRMLITLECPTHLTIAMYIGVRAYAIYKGRK